MLSDFRVLPVLDAKMPLFSSFAFFFCECDKQANTALHRACQHGNLEVGRLLIEAGAERAPKNMDGQSPADRARQGNSDAHAFLLRLLEGQVRGS